MSTQQFGDLVLVPFPFTDGSAAKQRPAVVVSSAAYNTQRPDLIVMAVTSQFKLSAVVGEVEIIEWQKAGLLKPSVVKPVIATLEKNLVRKQLGALEETDSETLRAAFKLIIG
jgi:mRNA interferase MazF